MKKLTITADDYGLSPFFNKGIIELAEKRIIRNISVMIKRAFVKPNELNRFPRVAVGLHL